MRMILTNYCISYNEKDNNPLKNNRLTFRLVHNDNFITKLVSLDHQDIEFRTDNAGLSVQDVKHDPAYCIDILQQIVNSDKLALKVA